MRAIVSSSASSDSPPVTGARPILPSVPKSIFASVVQHLEGLAHSHQDEWGQVSEPKPPLAAPVHSEAAQRDHGGHVRVFHTQVDRDARPLVAEIVPVLEPAYHAV